MFCAKRLKTRNNAQEKNISFTTSNSNKILSTLLTNFLGNAETVEKKKENADNGENIAWQLFQEIRCPEGTLADDIA